MTHLVANSEAIRVQPSTDMTLLQFDISCDQGYGWIGSVYLDSVCGDEQDKNVAVIFECTCPSIEYTCIKLLRPNDEIREAFLVVIACRIVRED